MSVNTTNAYGKIYISDDAIASLVAHTVSECYGVAGLAKKKYVRRNRNGIFENDKIEKKAKEGVKILSLDNKIYIDLFLVLVHGVSLNAVCSSIKKTVKYNVESFTGMIVDSVNIRVTGVTNKINSNVVSVGEDDDTQKNEKEETEQSEKDNKPIGYREKL